MGRAYYYQLICIMAANFKRELSIESLREPTSVLDNLLFLEEDDTSYKLMQLYIWAAMRETLSSRFPTR